MSHGLAVRPQKQSRNGGVGRLNGLPKKNLNTESVRTAGSCIAEAKALRYWSHALPPHRAQCLKELIDDGVAFEAQRRFPQPLGLHRSFQGL